VRRGNQNQPKKCNIPKSDSLHRFTHPGLFNWTFQLGLRSIRGRSPQEPKGAPRNPNLRWVPTKPMVIRWACSAPLSEQVMLLEPRFFWELRQIYRVHSDTFLESRRLPGASWNGIRLGFANFSHLQSRRLFFPCVETVYAVVARNSALRSECSSGVSTARAAANELLSRNKPTLRKEIPIYRQWPNFRIDLVWE